MEKIRMMARMRYDAPGCVRFKFRTLRLAQSCRRSHSVVNTCANSVSRELELRSGDVPGAAGRAPARPTDPLVEALVGLSHDASPVGHAAQRREFEPYAPVQPPVRSYERDVVADAAPPAKNSYLSDLNEQACRRFAVSV